jgi:hypothetical protein
VDADAVQEAVAGRGHAAAENDQLRVDDVHQVHRPNRQIKSGFLHDTAGQFVAVRRREHVPRCKLLGGSQYGMKRRSVAVRRQRFPRPCDDGRGAGVSLQAAEPAATAAPRVRHLDLDMADLGAVAVLALDDVTAVVAGHDNAAADAGAERE